VPYHAIATVRTAARSGSIAFGIDLQSAPLAALWDHRVQGHVLAPGAVLLEMGAAAARLLTGAHAKHLSATEVPRIL
jgi:hypothetical protein